MVTVHGVLWQCKPLSSSAKAGQLLHAAKSYHPRVGDGGGNGILFNHEK